MWRVEFTSAGCRLFAASRFPCRISGEMPIGPGRAWAIRAALASERKNQYESANIPYDL